MTTVLAAESEGDFKIIAELARSIWTAHYTPIIGPDQVEYMLDKFQSEAAIREQIKSGVWYYLLKHQGDFVGYFSYYKQDDHHFLSKLYIFKSVRGKGIGKAALKFLEEQTRGADLNKIRLTVNKYNSNSIAAYEKMGFKNIKAVVQDIGGGYVMDDYVLEKSI